MFNSFSFLLVLAACLCAAPSTYNILKLPAGEKVVVDADLSEWPEAYFVDSIRSDNNVDCADDTLIPWTPDRIQFKVYAAHDDINLYFAIKVTSDNLIKVCGTYECDCIKVNPGGQAAAFYVWSNNTIQRNPSNPYTLGINMDAKADSIGNGNLPTYEFYIAKDVLDQFISGGPWKIFIGMEDNDRINLAVGFDKVSNHDWNDCWSREPWDYSFYYPTWTLSDTVGPPLNVVLERGKETAGVENMVTANPNPFNLATTIQFTNPLHDAAIFITDICGRIVSKQNHISGTKYAWNAANQPSGIYIIKLSAAGKAFCKRVCFAK
jgi:hypothetical protein